MTGSPKSNSEHTDTCTCTHAHSRTPGWLSTLHYTSSSADRDTCRLSQGTTRTVLIRGLAYSHRTFQNTSAHHLSCVITVLFERLLLFQDLPREYETQLSQICFFKVRLNSHFELGGGTEAQTLTTQVWQFNIGKA